MEDREDLELIARVVGQDRFAFDRLFNKYSPELFRFIKKFIDSSETAEELLQEVFLKVYQKSSTFSGKSLVKTWIYQIARNQIIDFYRKNARNRPVENLIDRLKAGEKKAVKDYPVLSRENTEAKIIKKEILEIIDAEIENLDFDEKMVFTLKYFLGKKNYEIKEISGFSLRKTMYKLKSAIEKISKGMGRRGITKDVLNEI